MTSIFSTEAVRPKGPAHGTIFIILALPPINSKSKYGFIFKCLYNGKSAGIVIKNVEAPEPSRCAIAATKTVPILTVITFPLVSRIIFRIKGSKSPASCMTPKNKIAKINMIATSITVNAPSVKKSPISENPKPAISAPINGTSTMATIGVTLLLISSTTIIKIVKKPIILKLTLIPLPN